MPPADPLEAVREVADAAEHNASDPYYPPRKATLKTMAAQLRAALPVLERAVRFRELWDDSVERPNAADVCALRDQLERALQERDALAAGWESVKADRDEAWARVGELDAQNTRNLEALVEEIQNRDAARSQLSEARERERGLELRLEIALRRDEKEDARGE